MSAANVQRTLWGDKTRDSAEARQGIVGPPYEAILGETMACAGRAMPRLLGFGRLALIILALCYVSLMGARAADESELYDNGVALMGQKKYSEAAAEFIKSIKADPRYREAWQALADALRAEGKNDQGAAVQKMADAAPAARAGDAPPLTAAQQQVLEAAAANAPATPVTKAAVTKTAAPAKPAPAAPVKAIKPPPLAPKPGYAAGRVLMANGKPITVPGAKIVVAIHGTSIQSGERVEYTAPVQADGSYQQRLADGSYHYFAAFVLMPFNGKTFHLDLEPVGDDKADRESKPGIVQNYVWKIQGARPGHDGNESLFTDWYGASVNMHLDSYRNDLKKSVPAPPKGSKCVFTITPKGKLIDGSEGKLLTFTRDYDMLLGGLKDSNLPDVPIGVYTVTGEEVAPDGTKKPLLMSPAYATYGDSVEITFEPGSSIGPWPKNVNFTRPQQ